MAFSPEQEYIIVADKIHIRHFHAFKEQYIVRPPYQRKRVWDTRKKQDLLDSLFRRYFIPSIVLREVRLSPHDSRKEVIDGQQRISTVQEFYENRLKLPDKLKDVDSRLPGKLYCELHPDIRAFIDFELRLNADIIKNIQDPHSFRHLEIASEIFWRLQQGESLNKIETAHARIFSPVRNFLVKYADEYDFDFEKYSAIDPNPKKHKFFHETYKRTNTRMQHLAMLGRFLLFERADGPTSVGDSVIARLIDDTQVKDEGVGNMSYEKTKEAKALIKVLNQLRKVYQDDPKLDLDWVGVVIFRWKYFVDSCYLLLRHLMNFYVYDEEVRLSYRDFTYSFFRRINKTRARDDLARTFVEHNQQSQADIELRDRIIRHEFFKFALEEKKVSFVEKDKQQAFSEAQRIAIYLRDGGICKMCEDCGKPENECVAPWNDFHADHIIPYSKGGPTTIENGQVLCSAHNLAKGASYDG